MNDVAFFSQVLFLALAGAFVLTIGAYLRIALAASRWGGPLLREGLALGADDNDFY